MPDLLSYVELQKLVRELPADQKKLWDDMVPSVVSTATVQRVLQGLLKERVSIRDLPAILEGIGEAASQTTGVTALIEHVRARLARQLCWSNRSDDGSLPIVTLSPEWETAFAEALVGPGEDKQLSLAPSKLQAFIRGVREAFDRVAQNGETGVLLTSPAIRPYVRSIIERFRGQTVVMSQNEIHPRARLKTVGMV
jgi:flagellar biosynthesis protein FlhA